MVTAATLRRALATGHLTPSEIAERALDAAARLADLRIFIALDGADVRAQAAAATARWRAGQVRSPLDGIPIAVKDQFDARGYPTTCGTGLRPAPAGADAEAVARLRRAGAIIFGKTNMYELALGPTGTNAHHGAARNPWARERDSGGSSSGSAVAVAAGVVPIALGTDLGGSLRIPAALCGVVALKPTFGRVPTSGLVAIAPSLEHAGPIGATVEDVRLAFTALVGESLELPALRDLRLGVSGEWWERAEPETARIAAVAVDRLVGLGAKRRAIRLPSLDAGLAAADLVVIAEAAAEVGGLLAWPGALGPAARVPLALGRAVGATTYLRARRVLERLAGEVGAAMAEVDLIVTPTTDGPARPYRPAALGAGEIDEAGFGARIGFTLPFNVAGLPAAQVRCGCDGDGLPVGLQLAGRAGCEATVLAASQAVEQATRAAEGPRRPPFGLDPWPA